jgi:hypothetical protein
MGIQVVSRVTCTPSRQGKKSLYEYTKQIVCNVRGGLARSGSSCLCGYIQVTEKPTESEDTAVGGKRISVVKQGRETTETEGTQARKK